MAANKRKHAFWLTPEAKAMVEEDAHADNCGPEVLPQHGQAGVGRAGAARVSGTPAPLPAQRQQYLQSLHRAIKKQT